MTKTKKTQLIIVQERDLQYNEVSVIGIADSIDNAELMMHEYYGDGLKIISHKEVRENIEWIKEIEAPDHAGKMQKAVVWTEWFTLNEC